jgi:anti-sigma regulatory factor (Ser/Thr protein kinase)
MANDKTGSADCFTSAAWDDAWENNVALTDGGGPAALQEILPLQDMAWSGDRFQVPADLAYGTMVRRRIQSLATDHAMSPDDTADLVLAVSEAFNNAVRHGTSGPEDPIEFTVRFAEGTATIELRYLGESFPIQTPSLPAESSSNGRGRYIMAMLLDRMDYRFDAPWTVLRLAKQYRTLAAPPVGQSRA